MFGLAYQVCFTGAASKNINDKHFMVPERCRELELHLQETMTRLLRWPLHPREAWTDNVWLLVGPNRAAGSQCQFLYILQ
jgi:hypothetical protein